MRRMRSLAGVLIAFGLVWTMLASSGSAKTASNFQALSVDGDQFMNYDNTTTSAAGWTADWPANMMFFDDADVGKVKDYYWGTATAGTMYHRANDGWSWYWDSDKGTKTGNCVTFQHMRLYAPPGTDRSYNPSWGYYVIGTTHLDENECSFFFATYGWSETAEEFMAQHARDEGLEVHEDFSYWSNKEIERTEGDHTWLNSGRTTYVRIE